MEAYRLNESEVVELLRLTDLLLLGDLLLSL